MLQKYQHLLPAAPLMVAGVTALRHGAHGFELVLAIFEVGTSALLVATVIRELRAARRGASPHASHHPHAVDWFHVVAAGVLATEAAERWHLTHHFPRPMLLTAAVTLALGLFHGRIDAGIQRRRALRLTDDELYFSARPWARFRARWEDVTAIDLDPRYATIRTRDGRTGRLDLADLENAERVRAVLTDARSRLTSNTSTVE